MKEFRKIIGIYGQSLEESLILKQACDGKSSNQNKKAMLLDSNDYIENIEQMKAIRKYMDRVDSEPDNDKFHQIYSNQNSSEMFNLYQQDLENDKELRQHDVHPRDDYVGGQDLNYRGSIDGGSDIYSNDERRLMKGRSLLNPSIKSPNTQNPISQSESETDGYRPRQLHMYRDESQYPLEPIELQSKLTNTG